MHVLLETFSKNLEGTKQWLLDRLNTQYEKQR
jgi:hypothetical protein